MGYKEYEAARWTSIGVNWRQEPLLTLAHLMTLNLISSVKLLYISGKEIVLAQTDSTKSKCYSEKAKQQNSVQFTHLMVNHFILNRFHGSLKVLKENSHGYFWTNNCSANSFSNIFVLCIFLLGIIRTFVLWKLALHLRNNNYFNWI